MVTLGFRVKGVESLGSLELGMLRIPDLGFVVAGFGLRMGYSLHCSTCSGLSLNPKP